MVNHPPSANANYLEIVQLSGNSVTVTYNNNNIYLLQLGFHPVAVVILHVHKT